MECDEQTTVIPISLGYVKAFVVKGERPILIDAGPKGSADKVIKALKENNIYPEDISLIVITHAHTDHYGGLYELKQKIGAKVAIHVSEAEYMKMGVNSELVAKGILLRLAMKLTASFKVNGVNAEILLEDNFDLLKYGIDGTIIHTPGHTNGSISLVLRDKNIIVGDMIGGKGAAKKEPCIPGIVSDMEKLKKSIKRILDNDINNIYTSHGSVYVPSQVEALIN